MADKGIIFSAPMVRALLDGRKTQTRRLLTLRGYRTFSEFGLSDTPGYDWHFRREDGCWCDYRESDLPLAYTPDDRLWVRENLKWNREGDDRFFYAADGTDVPQEIIPEGEQITNPNLPSIFMPRWASRLWLDVTEVAVQRLQDIGEADAIAEGIFYTGEDVPSYRRFFIPNGDCTFIGSTSIECYSALWNSLHGKPGTTWADNPWVAAVTFTVNKGNVDG